MLNKNKNKMEDKKFRLLIMLKDGNGLILTYSDYHECKENFNELNGAYTSSITMTDNEGIVLMEFINGDVL